jgi:hypothetical protein
VNRVYKKPNGCNATGALAPGPDPQQQVDTITVFSENVYHVDITDQFKNIYHVK